jgi:hypothetical protein
MVKTKQEFMLHNHILSSNKELCSDGIQISHSFIHSLINQGLLV